MLDKIEELGEGTREFILVMLLGFIVIVAAFGMYVSDVSTAASKTIIVGEREPPEISRIVRSCVNDISTRNPAFGLRVSRDIEGWCRNLGKPVLESKTMDLDEKINALIEIYWPERGH